mgnify:CR=1 FL=1
MIIFNTTYHVDDELEASFIAWLKENYIPMALRREELSEPQLCRVMTTGEEDGSSLSLQFHVQDTFDGAYYADVLVGEGGRTVVGVELTEALVSRFGDRVVGFNTLLEVID